MNLNMLKCLAFAAIVGFAGTAQAADSGGEFNFVAPYDGSILSLDPHKTSKQQDLLVTNNIFRSLYMWSAEHRKPMLELANLESVSDDGLTYTYKLHADMMFHNGRAMKASDIVYSYERMLSMKPVSPNAGHIQIIQGAKAFESGEADHVEGLSVLDDLRFSITLNDRVDPAYYFYRPGTAIVPQEAVEAAGDEFGLSPVGSGPFKFEEWVKGSEVKLSKFDNYFEAQKPYLDKLNFKILQEGSTRDIAFRANELDAILVEASQYPQYKADPSYSEHLVEVAEMFTRLISWNADYAPLSDKKVRQAISYAIDEDTINKKFLKGKAYNPVGWLPSTSEAFDANGKGFGYDVEKAKALMAEAGYADGFELEILGTANKSYGVGVAEVVGQYLSKIGITVTTQQLEGGILYDKLVAGDFQGIIWSFGSGVEPLKALKRWHSTTANDSGNYVKYNNPEYDALLDKAQNTNDEQKRVEYLQAADRIFADDAAVWLFNYNKAVLAVQPWVHGIEPVAIEIMYQDFADVWVDANSPRAK
jgi:peptide/nickel transport system substrate-binding protein